ncbi:bifunctional diaminohydroxyphosphoribosylaminopyrimidine deaminase/5-amino-6-(5-phosphoribosylamino)uracil reductase RibD [Sphingomonas sp. 28-63-12]|uniref:bifunctional diaminohydroxyphosphoribosylaminopyrimidine deaminase/5-amino-6-(5-phosphoribosylamino)uracil reductase RibD n=1 Tax=Sphingomonas sp. 28-63-12 TaxID=1970434 RepID=UPI000BD3DB38|nr:MAG: riboflavin biosynthesis protein RibD [Sphingomonas sp. 28-63-12]
MGSALALGERGRGRTAPNPHVGCVIVKNGHVVGRGWTQPGGRPHAEAMALAMAGDAARGATLYTTLEPCAHRSTRGPACAGLLADAGLASVVIALGDPDPRTNGNGITQLKAAGITVITGVCGDAARRSMGGFLMRLMRGRPQVTLKLATSLDGCIALANGESRWITGPVARAHAHLERARHEAILVGRGTRDADSPALDVRLAGLEDRSPRRLVLTRHPAEHRDAEPGWETVTAPADIAGLPDVNDLLVEGGAHTAAAFLAADLVDRLLLYRAPILIGAGKASLGDIGLGKLGDAHGRWRLDDARQLGSDRLEVYERWRG